MTNLTISGMDLNQVLVKRSFTPETGRYRQKCPPKVSRKIWTSTVLAREQISRSYPCLEEPFDPIFMKEIEDI